jgi:hypothetical protein
VGNGESEIALHSSVMAHRSLIPLSLPAMHGSHHELPVFDRESNGPTIPSALSSSVELQVGTGSMLLPVALDVPERPDTPELNPSEMFAARCLVYDSDLPIILPEGVLSALRDAMSTEKTHTEMAFEEIRSTTFAHDCTICSVLFYSAADHACWLAIRKHRKPDT